MLKGYLTAEEARSLTLSLYSKAFLREKEKVANAITREIHLDQIYASVWIPKPLVRPIRMWLSSLGFSTEVDLKNEDDGLCPPSIKIWIYW